MTEIPFRLLRDGMIDYPRSIILLAETVSESTPSRAGTAAA